MATANMHGERSPWLTPVGLISIVLALGACSAPKATPVPTSISSVTGSASASPESTTWHPCNASAPQTWNRALSASRQHRRDGAWVLPFAMDAATGTVLQSERLDGHFNRLVMVRGSTRRTVMDIPQGRQVLSIAWDGRWAAIILTGQTMENEFQGFLWDSQAQREPRAFARSYVDPSTGEAFAGVRPDPIIIDGAVYWTQIFADHPNTAVVSRLDLSTGRRESVNESQGSGSIPQPLGTDVIWTQARTAQRDSFGFRGWSRSGRTAAELPEAVRNVTTQGFEYYASDGHTLVWTEEPRGTIHVWREGWPEAKSVETGLEYADGLSVSENLVVFNDPDRSWALDLRTGAFTPITPEFGSPLSQGGMLRVGYAPKTKSAGGDVSVVKQSELPPLTCR